MKYTLAVAVFAMLAITAAAVPPSETMRLDIRARSRPFNLTLPAGTTPLLRAEILNGGSPYDVTGWTGTLYFATGSVAGAVVAIPATWVNGATVDFQVAAGKLASTGTFFAQVFITDHTNTVEWSRGTLKLLPSPASQGAAQTNFGATLDFDSFSSIIGTPPPMTVNATNEADPVALPVAVFAGRDATNAMLAATNADIKASVAQVLGTNAALAATNADLKASQAQALGTNAYTLAAAAQPAGLMTGYVPRAASVELEGYLGFAPGVVDSTNTGLRVRANQVVARNIGAAPYPALWMNYSPGPGHQLYFEQKIAAGVGFVGNGAELTNVTAAAASTFGGLPAASYALASSLNSMARYTNWPATATSAGAAGHVAVTNIGADIWLAIWGNNFQGTGVDGWGFVQLQTTRPGP